MSQAPDLADFDARARWMAQAVIPQEPALRRWLASRGFAPDDADDLVQEVYAKLAALDEVGHIRSVRAYMFTTAHMIVLSRLRRAKIVAIDSVEDVEAFSPPDETPDAETQVSDRQELKRLAQAVAALPPRRREIFILRKVHKLPQRAVAERLGISESTVETHLWNALHGLAEALGRVEKLKSRASTTQTPQAQLEASDEY